MGGILSIGENLGQTAIAGFPNLITFQPMAEERRFDYGEAVSDDVPAPDWGDVVLRIRQGVPSGMEDLYAIFGKGVRWMLLRQLGTEELEDRVHDCFIIVAEAIQQGELREPERLMGYVRTIVKRQIAGHIEELMHSRRNRAMYDEATSNVTDNAEDPEQSLWVQQRSEIAKRVLRGISKRDREILNRFYVLEQTQEQICGEMDLTYNQFRLLKSRAKARFGEMGKRLALGVGRRLGRS